jgi:hypothetical protein
LSVTDSFALGANSFFDDFGTMSVAGSFDPGVGNSIDNDAVGGTFNAAFGSSVTANTATWDVLTGGRLDSPTSRSVAKLLVRLKTAIAELGYEAIIEDL